MRKKHVFAATATITVAAATVTTMVSTRICVPAGESGTKKDVYLIIDIAGVETTKDASATASATSTFASATDSGTEQLVSSKKPDLSKPFYLDLHDLETTGSYTVTGMFVDEPIVSQLMSQKESFAGYDAMGSYEIVGTPIEDLDVYLLNLTMSSDYTLFHYSASGDTLIKTPLESVYGPQQEKNVSILSDTNHWVVVHFTKSDSVQTASVR